jgi:hypothetical protein
LSNILNKFGPPNFQALTLHEGTSLVCNLGEVGG